MIESEISYEEYLKSLKKDELNSIVANYNKLCSIYGFKKLENKKLKKEALVNEILECLNDYLKGVIMSLDKDDFEAIKSILKNNNNEVLNQYKNLINYLKSLKIIYQSDNLQISKEILEVIKKLIKDKEVANYIKENDYLYKLSEGIIIAYGVIDLNDFKEIIKHEYIIDLLDFYYKKDFDITDEMLLSKKLTNKKRINKYYKDKDYQQFSLKDFLALGNNSYHHSIKAYKKFIKMLKNNYVFKKRDLDFVDINVVIPYLYNSLNEEEIASKNLEDTVISLFEFKGEKLKQKMLQEIKLIRKDFPLWEYRGHTKNEKEHE
ncbi:hypothetical protein EGR52_12465 [bacterium]|nr:hypothetical protein [bacterium]